MKAQHEAEVAAILGAVNLGLADRQAADFVRQIAEESVDFAIVVAQPKELAALKLYFPELKHKTIERASMRSYYRGLIPTTGRGSYRLVATLLHSESNLETANATADLLRDWSPRFVIANGLAGGLSRGAQDFGDIVASDSIVYYEMAKVRSTGVEHWKRRFVADPTLLNGILNLTNSDDWRMRLPTRPDGREPSSIMPAIHIGPIASGEKVFAFASGPEAYRLRESHPNLVALEMESAGIASVAMSSVKNVGFLTIRGICDFADGTKDNSWQDYAARSAASCLRAFLEAGPVPPSEGTWPNVDRLMPSSKPRSSQELRKRLFDQLCTVLDMEEFKNFCFLLGIDVDDLPGDRKSARVRELILLFERRGQILDLENAMHENIPTRSA